MGEDHKKKFVQVPEKETFECESILIAPSDGGFDRDNQGGKTKSADPPTQKEERLSKHEHKDDECNDPSLSKQRKDNTQKINESDPQDTGVIPRISVSDIKIQIIQEYTNILDTIKAQNRNLKKIKTQMLSTRARNEREGLERLPYPGEDKLNEELAEAMVLQPKCPSEWWSKTHVAANALEESSESPSREHLDTRRRSAGEEKGFCNGNTSGSTDSSQCSTIPSSLDRSHCPSASASADILRGLLEKADSMVSCLNESKSLNDQIINLLKQGRDHLKHCNQCGPSSENCSKLERICEELRLVCNQKLKHLSGEGIIPQEENSSGDSTSFTNSCPSTGQDSKFSKNDSCSCSKKPQSSATKKTGLCCCKPKSESTEPSGLSKLDIGNIDTEKMLSMFECVAKELKDIKKRQDAKSFVPNPNAGLMSEIQPLRERLRELECENEELKCINQEQQVQAADLRKRYVEAKQTAEEQLAKILKMKKANDDLVKSVQAQKEEAERNYREKAAEFPKRLEEERNKLKDCLRDKEKVKQQIAAVQDNLKKEQEKRAMAANALKEEANKLKSDIRASQQRSDSLERENSAQKKEITDLKNQLSDLRKEASSMLAVIKERSERQMAEACRQIEDLEEELAKERTNLSCAIKEKEKCYKELEFALCSAHTSQVRVKKLQACVKALIEEINSSHRKTCCCSKD